MFMANSMPCSLIRTLDGRPKRLDPVGVNIAPDVLATTVCHRLRGRTRGRFRQRKSSPPSPPPHPQTPPSCPGPRCPRRGQPHHPWHDPPPRPPETSQPTATRAKPLGAVLVLLKPADERLVNLHRTRPTLRSRPHASRIRCSRNHAVCWVTPMYSAIRVLDAPLGPLTAM